MLSAGFSSRCAQNPRARMYRIPAQLQIDNKVENGHCRDSEAGGSGGGGAHFRGVDVEAEMGEIGLSEGHEAGVEVAPDEEEQEGNRGVIFVGDGVDDGAGEVEAEHYFRVWHPAGFVLVFLLGEGAFFPSDIEFGCAGELALLADDRFDYSLCIANGDADTGGHDEGHVEEGAPPVFGSEFALRDEVETRDGASGREEKRQVDHDHLEPTLVKADDHRGQEHRRKKNHERVADVGGEVEESLGFNMPGGVGSPDAGQDFLCGLHQAFGPARLLGFEAVHVDGQFGSAFDLRKVEKLPAFELRAIGKIGVFGKRVVFPAAGFFDGGTSPDAGGAVEIEECAAAGARSVFDDEMTVEQDGFDLSKEGIVAVEVSPAGLNHADF